MCVFVVGIFPSWFGSGLSPAHSASGRIMAPQFQNRTRRCDATVSGSVLLPRITRTRRSSDRVDHRLSLPEVEVSGEAATQDTRGLATEEWRGAPPEGKNAAPGARRRGREVVSTITPDCEAYPPFHSRTNSNYDDRRRSVLGVLPYFDNEAYGTKVLSSSDGLLAPVCGESRGYSAWSVTCDVVRAYFENTGYLRGFVPPMTEPFTGET